MGAHGLPVCTDKTPFKSMGNSFTTTSREAPVSQDGAESTSPTSTSPDVDSRSAQSCALASKGFKHDMGVPQQQHLGLAPNKRAPQDKGDGESSLDKNNYNIDAPPPSATLGRETWEPVDSVPPSPAKPGGLVI